MMTMKFERNRVVTPSRVPIWSWRTLRRCRYWLIRRVPSPPSRMLKPVFPSDRWTLVFIYAPTGKLAGPQRFMLERLRSMDRRLLVVCAAPEVDDVPAELSAVADALYWKGLSGFDFSGYAIGLHALAAGSPGTEALVLNDSTYGPFGDLQALIRDAPWELTGLIGSKQFEAHFQSFAFVLRGVTPARMRRLRGIFPRSYAYNEIKPVVLCLETRFARVASRHMSVGCLWNGPDDGTDPSIEHGLALLADGFPFLKRGLLGKHRGRQDVASVREALAERGCPADGP